jgi:hypothetical protein
MPRRDSLKPIVEGSSRLRATIAGASALKALMLAGYFEIDVFCDCVT